MTQDKGQVPAIQRYKIGYHSDEWGVRSLSPTGIYDDAGPWVRYEDHAAVITALRTQQPAPATQQAGEVDNLRKALQFYANGEHFIKSDDNAWDTVSGEPQNYWCDEAGTATVEDGSIARLALVGHQIKFEDEEPQPSPTAQAAESVPAPVRDYPPLPTRRRTFLCTKCGGRECEPGTIGESHPPCKCGYLGFAEDLDFTADDMRAFADETYALRIGAKHA